MSSTGAKQQKIPKPEIPETASISANRQLVESAMAAHKLTGYELQLLRDAWEHEPNWKSEHTLWFRYSAQVAAILDRIDPTRGNK